MCRRRCLLVIVLLCVGAPTWTQGEGQASEEDQSANKTEEVEGGVPEGKSSQPQVNSPQSQGTDARTSENQDSDEEESAPESHSQSAGLGSSPPEGVASKKKDRDIVRFVPELSPNIMNPGRLSNGSWYIMFYTSWCEYSQQALPHFLEVFQHIVDTNTSGVYIGKIDVTKHGEVVKHFKIKATPTFIFFKKGTRYEFVGVATAENLKDFMIRLLRSEVSQVNTSQQLAELQKTHPVIYIFADDGELDPDWKAIYMKLANEKILRARYLYTTNPDVLKEFQVLSFPAILVIKDGASHPFKGALSDYTFSRWLALERFTAFPTVNATTVHSYLSLSLGRKLGVLVVDADPAKRRVAQRKAIEVVRKVAESRKLHKSFQLILLESVEIGERLTQGSGLELPALFVFEHFTGYYYIYKTSEDEKGLTEKSVISFLNDVLHNKVQPQGGPSFYYTLVRLRDRIYATVQTMITHRPVLSGAAVLSLLGMILFYITIYCGWRPKKQQARLRAIRNRQRASKPQRDSCNSVRQRRRVEQEEPEELEGSESTGGSASESASYSETESRKDK